MSINYYFHVDSIISESNDKLDKMLKIKDSCDIIKIKYPEEVDKYFEKICEERELDWYKRSIEEIKDAAMSKQLDSFEIYEDLSQEKHKLKTFENGEKRGFEIKKEDFPDGCDYLRVYMEISY